MSAAASTFGHAMSIFSISVDIYFQCVEGIDTCCVENVGADDNPTPAAR